MTPVRGRPIRFRLTFFEFAMFLSYKKVALIEALSSPGPKLSHMCHGIRVALQDKEFQKLMGIVELDETFIGGKRNATRHSSWRAAGPT
jgi:hypothetical protein